MSTVNQDDFYIGEGFATRAWNEHCRLIKANADLLAALKDAKEEIEAWREWAEREHGRGACPEKPLVTTVVLRNISAAIAKTN